MNRRHAFELHLPTSYRVAGWEADRHEAITTWVVGSEEGPGATPTVGVDCYLRRDHVWATEIWWTFQQPGSTAHFARAPLPVTGGVHRDGAEARLRSAELALLGAVRRLGTGEAAASPDRWHESLLDEALAGSFDAIAGAEWLSTAAVGEVVGDTTGVLAGPGRHGFVIYARPRAALRHGVGPVTVTVVIEGGSKEARLTVEPAADTSVALRAAARVRVAAPLWAEIVPLTEAPQERHVHGAARPEDVSVSFLLPA